MFGCIGDIGENWRNSAPENMVCLPRWTLYRHRVHTNERCNVRLSNDCVKVNFSSE